MYTRTPTLIEQKKRDLNYTIATQRIERCNPSKYALQLCEKMSDKEISADEAVRAVLKKYKLG